MPFSASFWTRYSAKRLPHNPGLICSSSPSYGGNLDDRNSTCVFIARNHLTSWSIDYCASRTSRRFSGLSPALVDRLLADGLFHQWSKLRPNTQARVAARSGSHLLGQVSVHSR